MSSNILIQKNEDRSVYILRDISLRAVYLYFFHESFRKFQRQPVMLITMWRLPPPCWDSERLASVSPAEGSWHQVSEGHHEDLASVPPEASWDQLTQLLCPRLSAAWTQRLSPAEVSCQSWPQFPPRCPRQVSSSQGSSAPRSGREERARLRSRSSRGGVLGRRLWLQPASAWYFSRKSLMSRAVIAASFQPWLFCRLRGSFRKHWAVRHWWESHWCCCIPDSL